MKIFIQIGTNIGGSIARTQLMLELPDAVPSEVLARMVILRMKKGGLKNYFDTVKGLQKDAVNGQHSGNGADGK